MNNNNINVYLYNVGVDKYGQEKQLNCLKRLFNLHVKFFLKSSNI